MFLSLVSLGNVLVGTMFALCYIFQKKCKMYRTFKLLLC